MSIRKKYTNDAFNNANELPQNHLFDAPSAHNATSAAPLILSGGDGDDRLIGGRGDDVLYGHSASDRDQSAGNIVTRTIANIGGGAVYMTTAPGDNGFIYGLTKDDGIIHRINVQTGASTDFLDIADGQFFSGGERGVLSVAFHPDYATNGRFFVYLTNNDGDIEIREYARSGDPTVATAGVVQSIITIPHPGESNHNGGTLAFGPDGYLYFGTGDGGGGGDPNGNAQNT